MELKRMGWSDYFIHFYDPADSGADCAAKLSLRSGGAAVAAFERQQPAGFCCCQGSELLYCKVFEPFRGRGIGSALLCACAEELHRRGAAVMTARRIGDDRLLLNCGFRRSEASTVFRCRIDKGNRARWQTLRAQRLEPPFSRLDRAGFETLSFRARPPKADQLSYFGMNPQLFERAGGQRLDELSFAGWLGGELVAYSAVTAAGKQALVFRQLEVRKDFRRTGAFLLPLTASLDVVAQSKYQKIAFTVSEENTQMNRLVQHLLNPFAEHAVRQWTYRLQL